MDLIQLESAADLLSADTEAQRLQALELMVGKQSSVYARWRSELLSCLANIEVTSSISAVSPSLSILQPRARSCGRCRKPGMSFLSGCCRVGGLQLTRSCGPLELCLLAGEAVLDFGEDAELGNEVALSIVPRVAALRREVDRSFVNGRPHLQRGSSTDTASFTCPERSTSRGGSLMTSFYCPSPGAGAHPCQDQRAFSVPVACEPCGLL